MQGWAEELLTAVDGLEEEQAIFERMERAASILGFDRCAYGLRAPLPITNPKVVMVNNYSDSWRTRYEQAGYLAVDPTVLHGKRSQIPLVWCDELFAPVPALWEEAQAEGLRVGWAQSSLDGFGVGGMLTLARSHEPLTAAELAAKELKMRWLVNIAHLAFSRVLAPKVLVGCDVGLTRRETEVLQWHADGKTSSEISEILTISVDTVKFHTKNAVSKLGAANKTAAVARAAMLGLLS